MVEGLSGVEEGGQQSRELLPERTAFTVDNGAAGLFGTASIVASNEAQFSGFAIGNTSGGFGVTVIPEPGTYAALAGLLMLGLALLRRCRA
ncbi:MAG: PEP-CTERM sorting domain-containing protein [Opitutales bacterium]|nr:PEP-CTERM sorting domain-containing protein [Opitutales bacterium]